MNISKIPVELSSGTQHNIKVTVKNCVDFGDIFGQYWGFPDFQGPLIGNGCDLAHSAHNFLLYVITFSNTEHLCFLSLTF